MGAGVPSSGERSGQGVDRSDNGGVAPVQPGRWFKSRLFWLEVVAFILFVAWWVFPARLGFALWSWGNHLCAVDSDLQTVGFAYAGPDSGFAGVPFSWSPEQHGTLDGDEGSGLPKFVDFSYFGDGDGGYLKIALWFCALVYLVIGGLVVLAWQRRKCRLYRKGCRSNQDWPWTRIWGTVVDTIRDTSRDES